jgi:intracellular sulfur oxidation DsrE/DsrF family protein
VSRHLELAELHGATVEDVVPAGVAEVVMLQAKGFAYLKL